MPSENDTGRSRRASGIPEQTSLIVMEELEI